jgi:hypothetical protein
MRRANKAQQNNNEKECFVTSMMGEKMIGVSPSNRVADARHQTITQHVNDREMFSRN